jgi:uncharacterized protein (TIGR03435 family)
MIHRIAIKLELRKRVLVGGVCIAFFLGPVVFEASNPLSIRAQAIEQSTRAVVPSFEAVTIKTNKTEPMTDFSTQVGPLRAVAFKAGQFTARNIQLYALIAMAYQVEVGSEISGGPDWVRSESYDIEAKLDSSVVEDMSKLDAGQRFLEQKRILQVLLADRFRLAVHRRMREPPAYALAIAKDGLKLQEAKPDSTSPDAFKDSHGQSAAAGALFESGPCKLVGQGVHLADLAKALSVHYLGGLIVVDRTGLTGVYDFTLDLNCDSALMERGESALASLPQQLGLELKPLDVLVIDRAEKPSEN